MFRVIISVDGGENMYPSTDSELQVIDRFKYPLKAIANSSDVIYRSDWLYDEDERVREEAIAGLEKVDARTAVEQLTEFFKHDTSDAVREKAAQALGRIGSEEAAKQMHKAVSNYLDGDRSKPGLIATCAEALGSMRSREALDSLNQLLGLFEKKQLTTQAHTVKQAIYRIQYGRRLQETICIVCNQPIDEESELLQCPACKGVAHRDQLLEWLHVKDYCPKCHRHIDVSDVKGVSLSDLPSKTQARSHGRKR
jgi:Zn finger protein HypA/HybF involved in hydrogenase expression